MLPGTFSNALGDRKKRRKLHTIKKTFNFAVLLSACIENEKSLFELLRGVNT